MSMTDKQAHSHTSRDNRAELTSSSPHSSALKTMVTDTHTSRGWGNRGMMGGGGIKIIST